MFYKRHPPIPRHIAVVIVRAYDVTVALLCAVVGKPEGSARRNTRVGLRPFERPTRANTNAYKIILPTYCEKPLVKYGNLTATLADENLGEFGTPCSL